MTGEAQRRVLVGLPEVPGIVVLGIRVQVDVPAGINARVAGGGLQRRSGLPPAGRGSRAGALPGGLFIPVAVADPARARVDPHQPAHAGRCSPADRAGRVGIADPAPVLPRQPAHLRRSAAAGGHYGVAGRYGAAVPAHQPAGRRRRPRSAGPARNAAVSVSDTDRTQVHARQRPHLPVGGGSRHAGRQQPQPADVAAAAHHAEQPQRAGVAGPAAPDVQVRYGMPVALEGSRVGAAAVAHRQPPLAVMPEIIVG